MELSTTALQIAYLLRCECLGRRRLAERMGVGEMIVRRELERLRQSGWVQCDRSGCRLTQAGERRFAPVLPPVRRIEEVDLRGLSLDALHLAAHLDRVSEVPHAWILRDAAVREGATGLLLLRRAGDEWSFSHNAEPVRTRNPGDAERIDATFPEVGRGDALLIVSGPDRPTCAAGMWGALRRWPHSRG